MNGTYCRVHLRVRCDAKIGQTVAVLGSHQSLGGFNTSKPLSLVTTPESYPVWYTLKPLIIPKDTIVYYKYCILEAGDFKHYEGRTDSPNIAKTTKNVSNSSNSHEHETDSRCVVVTEEDVTIEEEFTELLTNTDASREDIEQSLLKEMMHTEEVDPSNSIQEIFSSKSLFLVCYHLPVQIKRRVKVSVDSNSDIFEINWSDSILAKSKNSVSEQCTTYWVGCISVEHLQCTEVELIILENQLTSINCFPMLIDKALAEAHYQGYCKKVMWPIFHNVDQLDHIHAAWNLSSDQNQLKQLDWTNYHDKYYDAYKTVNSKFATLLASIALPKDTVWVHDYHLMLLPKLLRNSCLDIDIVFFLHIPFPTSQIFRALPDATDLLQSLTCADVVGFHAFDHARHFLNACKRVLGIRSHNKKGGMLSLVVKDREVIVTMSHVSIEPDAIDEIVSSPVTQSIVSEYKKKYLGKKIIVGVDVCQRLSGGILKLAALDKLLVDNHDMCNRIVLIQRMMRPGARVADEEYTSNDMKRMVESLNRKFTKQDQLPIIDYAELSSLSIYEKVALWLVADVFLLTPIREGLNLYPLEYIYARKNLDHAGVVIASEFSTISSLLSGSLKINPFYALNIADAMDKALSMSSSECAQRRQRDIGFVSSHPSNMWTKQILADLHDMKSDKKQKVEAVMPELLDFSLLRESYDINTSKIISKCDRVFVLDYGGTLLHKEKFDIYIKQSLSAIAGRKPTSRMMKALETLSSDPRNAIIIVTGLTKIKLGDTFGGFKNITLATSNGLVYSWGENLLSASEMLEKTKHEGSLNRIDSFDERLESAILEASRARKRSNSSAQILCTFDDGYSPSAPHSKSLDLIEPGGYYSTTSKRLWECMDFKIDWIMVRNIAVPIMTKFASRTNGTCLSPRIPGIGWSYFGADPEWGEKQASQLRLELDASLVNYNVMVTSQIQGSIEVVPKDLNKGVIVKLFMERVMNLRAGKLPSFIAIIGDEVSDDKMFDAFYETIATVPTGAGTKQMKAYTVTIGKRESSADYYTNEVQDIESLLTELAESHTTIPTEEPCMMIVDQTTC